MRAYELCEPDDLVRGDPSRPLLAQPALASHVTASTKIICQLLIFLLYSTLGHYI